MFEGRTRITLDNVHRLQKSTEIKHRRACSFAWSPDGRTLALGDWPDVDWSQRDSDWSGPSEVDRPAPTSLWLYPTDYLDRLPLRLDGHQSTVGALAFSPEGKLLVSAAYDSTVRFWDAKSGEQLRWQRTPGYSMHTLAVSHDGILLAAGGSEQYGDPYDGTGIIVIWNIETGSQEVIQEYDRWVANVVFNPTNTLLAYSTLDGIVRMWDVKRGQEWAHLVLPNYDMPWVSMAFQGDELLMMPTDDYRSSVEVWNWKTGEHRILGKLPWALTFSVFHPTESLAAFRTDNYLVSRSEQFRDVVPLLNWAVQDLTTSAPLRVIEPGSTRVGALGFNPDGSLLTIVEENAVTLWGVE